MKLRVIGSNQTEVETGNLVIFFSYNTPVAFDNGEEVSVTRKKWSRTTSRHISKWLGGRVYKLIDQEVLDRIERLVSI